MGRLKGATVSFVFVMCLALGLAACGSVPKAPDPSQRTGYERYGEGRHGELRSSSVTFPGDSTPTVVEYEVLDGLAIYEGDIVLGRVRPDGTLDTQALALRFGGLWPDGVVPYIISGTLRDAVFHRDGLAMVDLVAQAMAHWELTTPVRFLPVTMANVSSYPDVVIFYSGDGCAAEAGHKGGVQGVWLGERCGFGEIVHEIGHTLGLMHEHSRGDRDDFVEILLDNVEPWIDANDELVEDGYHRQFERLWINRSIGPYDYDSIMHYPSWGFANDTRSCRAGDLGACTVLPRNGIDPRRIGQVNGLSACDVTAIGTMYGVQLAPGCPGQVLAAGADFSLAIAADGSLWGWGSSGFGQFGEAVDDLDDRDRWQRPERVDLPAPPVSVSIGPSSLRSSILLNDGTVYTMGPRWSVGEGGIGWALQSNVEVRPVLGLKEAHAIVAGRGSNLALHRDGTVSIWSNRYHSEMGDGIEVPARAVPGLSDVMAVAAGGHFQLALKTDGTVMAWGSNYLGQLGDGTTLNRDHPAPIPGLEGVVAIAAGDDFALALLDDGTVMTWGHGNFGQLGTGSTGYGRGSLTPQPVLGLDEVVAIAAGPEHVVALRDSGSLVAWGINYEGELGLGSTELTHSARPVAVVGIDRVVAIAAGGYSGVGGWWGHSVALREDGTLWTWGSNIGAELGDGPGPSTATPALVRLPPM